MKPSLKTQLDLAPIPTAEILALWDQALINRLNRQGKTLACPFCGHAESSLFFRWPIDDQFGLFDDDPERLLFIYGDHLRKDLSNKFVSEYRQAVFKLLAGRSHVDYLKCSACGLVFQNFPHTNKSTSFFYQRLYRLNEQWILPEKNVDVFGRNDERWLYQQESIGRYFLEASGLKPGAEVLDIGCAEGLVCCFLEKKGITAYGIEPSLPMANYALSVLGLKKITGGDYTPERYGPDAFDGIITHHVLEHVIDLTGFFAAVQRHLKQGGYLLLQAPCLDNIKSHTAYQRILTGGHIYGFSEKFLRNIITEHNFNILECKKSPLDLTELDPSNRAEWDTTVWADDPGGISFLAQKVRPLS
jgi:cyclopropane fatty-acyl-phospholipid synthase-like methyltransferase